MFYLPNIMNYHFDEPMNWTFHKWMSINRHPCMKSDRPHKDFTYRPSRHTSHTKSWLSSNLICNTHKMTSPNILLQTTFNFYAHCPSGWSNTSIKSHAWRSSVQTTAHHVLAKNIVVKNQKSSPITHILIGIARGKEIFHKFQIATCHTMVSNLDAKKLILLKSEM